jgi:tRNA (mo5U34)-methyltransferase
MLRSAGFVIDSNPEEEVYVCRPGPLPYGSGVVYPACSPVKRRMKGIAA